MLRARALVLTAGLLLLLAPAARGAIRVAGLVRAERAPAAAAALSPRLTAPVDALGLSADAGADARSGAAGAIGPAAYVEMVNHRVALYDRAGRPLATRPLDEFTNTPGAYDAQVEWDPQGRRFLYVTTGTDRGLDPASTADDTHYLAFGFSKTADPTGLAADWCSYRVNTDEQITMPGGKDDETRPRLGHDDGHVLIGTDALGTGGFATARLLFFAKPSPAPLTACPNPPTLSYFGSAEGPLPDGDGTRARSPVPADVRGSVASAPIVAAVRDSAGRGHALQVWHIDYAAADGPALYADFAPRVAGFGPPSDASQPGRAARIDTGNTGLTQAVAVPDPAARGRWAVWTAHTVAGAGGRSAIRWYEVLPQAGGLRQAGTVADSRDWLFAGALSPSRSGDGAVLLANASGPGHPPAIRAWARTRSTPLGVLTDATTLATSPDVVACGHATCAWAPSTAAGPDPATAGRVWGSAQLAGPRHGTAPAWTTRNLAVVADVAAPRIALSVPGRWIPAGRVRARYRCTDEPGGAGIASCVGSVPPGARVNTRPGRHTFTVRARDRAGHTTVLRRVYSVDRRAPAVTILSPERDATVRRGARLVGRYRCRDERGGSGIARCRGTVRSGRRLDTRRRGRHTLTVTASDRAGHRVTVRRSYRVR